MKKALTMVFCLMVVGCGGRSYSSGSGSGTSPISTYAVEVDCAIVLPDRTVVIQPGSFFPTNESITQNGVIEWTNNDTLTHTVTGGSAGSPNGYFDLSIIPATSKCLRFTATGTFLYFSRTNTSMVGQVFVQ